MLESTLAFVRRNMKVKTILTDDGTRADKAGHALKSLGEQGRSILLSGASDRDARQVELDISLRYNKDSFIQMTVRDEMKIHLMRRLE